MALLSSGQRYVSRPQPAFVAYAGDNKGNVLRTLAASKHQWTNHNAVQPDRHNGVQLSEQLRRAVGEERVHNRSGIGESGGLDYQCVKAAVMLQLV